VKTGPEAAIPIFMNHEIMAVLNVVAQPGSRFSRKEFYLIKDISEMLSHVLTNAKKHWEMTQEKIRISQMLSHLSPFVPQSVRKLLEENPAMLKQGKERKEVSVLFLDLEDYTRLSATRPETEINELVETMFSSFVDPIYRSHGDINETAGDGLMIIFKDNEERTNAIHCVQAAFDIRLISRGIHRELGPEVGPIHVNMGINSGTALVGMTLFKGSLGARMTYTASGPVTNLAARLASRAKGGDILMGEETRRLIQGLWPVYDRGHIRLKGIAEPVRIFSLVASA
jgi:class 3 adenylate cyclase